MKTRNSSYRALWLSLILLGGVALFFSQLWPAVACFGIALVLYLFRRFLIRRAEQTYSLSGSKHD
jgi:Na+/proline symporter